MDKQKHSRELHRRGRLEQIPIYLSKLLRSFIYQNDWKFLPMSAVIAALVSMVIRRDGFITMEGTMKASFALTCVAIWNGCFNSIQSVCRERNIVKREHRSGMHISAYIVSHMAYQALLCLAQTAVTLFTCTRLGVQLNGEGFITPWRLVDIGITLFLVAYASDMLSLLVSSVVHTTTAAMTVMPFLLIFQLVFSGGIFSLPGWAESFSNYTISNYGLKCVSAQADYNHLPMVTGWNTLNKLKDQTVGGTLSVNQILELMEKKDNPKIAQYREIVLVDDFTLGELVDILAVHPDLEEFRENTMDLSIRLGDLIDLVGENELRNAIEQKTGMVSRNPAYDLTYENIERYWGKLLLFIFVYSVLSVIVLEFIDKDRR